MKSSKELMKCFLMLVVAIGLLETGASDIAFTRSQPSSMEPLDRIVNLFLNQTLEKFDVVFFQGKAVTGVIKNSELSFFLESGQRTTYQTSEIAALVLDMSKGEFILRSGKRFLGQLLTALEITLAGFENQRIILTPEVLGTAIFKGQHKHLVSSAEFGARFQELLIDYLRSSMTRQDILVFKNDSILAGTVTNPVFQIDDLYFNKEAIAEIIFGSPDKLRTKSGQTVNGVIRNPIVTLQLTNNETRFPFATQTLASVLFEDPCIILAPKEMRGIVTQISEG